MKTVTAVWESDEVFSLTREYADDVSDRTIIENLCDVSGIDEDELYQVLVYTNGGESRAPEVRVMKLEAYDRADADSEDE